MPFSIAWFVITAVVVALQLSPYTGVFLMIFAAPYWSVLTLNLGFVGMGLEALIRSSVSRWWLILPVAWFGGYACWSTMDRIDIAHVATVVGQKNEGQFLHFSPDTTDLVIDDPAGRNLIDSLARDLSARYVIPAVYTSSQLDGRTVRETVYRVGPESLCARLGGMGMISSGLRHEPLQGSGSGCRYSMVETVLRPALTIRVAASSVSSQQDAVKVTTLDLTTPDGRTAHVTGGWVQPYGWIPIPVIGCALNSGESKWECFSKFARGRRLGLLTGQRDGDDMATLVARVLGLQTRHGEPAPDSAALERVETFRGARKAEALAAFERLVADPQADVDYNDIGALREYPDAVIANADRMTRVVESGFETSSGTSAIKALQDQLSRLPDTDFARLQPRLTKLYAAQPAVDEDVASEAMANRLGFVVRQRRLDDPDDGRAMIGKVHIVPLAEATVYEQQQAERRVADTRGQPSPSRISRRRQRS